jgi:hypothetical protein
MTTMTHADSYVRTEAGKTEIRAHSLQLSRSARNLLMVIDASCSGNDWVARVLGSSRDDLRQLVSARLVAPQGTAPSSRTVYQRITAQAAVRDWSYDALYTLLTHEARERFGLIKGYRMILKIEGATGAAGLQEVALEFVEQLRKAHGEEAATRFRKQLGATD